MKAIGVLSSGHLCEVTRADLVGQYAGHTAVKTTEVINGAVGGVLFIDEAYSLCQDKNDAFGLEAIDALVKEWKITGMIWWLSLRDMKMKCKNSLKRILD